MTVKSNLIQVYSCVTYYHKNIKFIFTIVVIIILCDIFVALHMLIYLSKTKFASTWSSKVSFHKLLQHCQKNNTWADSLFSGRKGRGNLLLVVEWSGVGLQNKTKTKDALATSSLESTCSILPSV